MIPTLRPDQSALEAAVYNGWNSGNRNMLAVLPTGGGKSVVMSEIISKCHNLGEILAVIAHRNELVGQMSVHVARRGIKHRIIGSASTIAEVTALHREEFNGRSFISPDAQSAVASIDTLNARTEALKNWFPRVNRWFLDECFPAGVMIQTPHGHRPIESIRIGDFVTAFDENTGAMMPRKVLRLFKNPAPNTMIDIKINGSHVTCTQGHPFWTDRGWVQAWELRENENLLVRMHGMSDAVHYDCGTSRLSLSQNRSCILSHKMRYDVSGQISETACEKTTKREVLSGVRIKSLSQKRRNVFERMCSENIFAYNVCHQSQVRIGKNETKQSDEASGCARENVGFITANKTPTTYSGWEWKNVAGSGTSIDRNALPSWVRVTTSDTDQSCKNYKRSTIIQTRYGFGVFQNSRGSGWPVTQCIGPSGSRCEERFHFSMSRVESIEVQKRTNIVGTGDGFVYNIEVDEFNTYIANGIVVHNCHHALKLNKWGKGIENFVNAYGLGVTATPKRGDGMGLGREWDGVFDDMVLGPTMRQLINMGALSEYEIAIPDSDFEISDDDFDKHGELSPKRGRELSKKSHIVGDVVIEYQKRALGKKFICFATDVETANEMANNFNAAGIACAAVSAKTPAHVRNEMIRRFKRGQLLGLVNVDLFGEGFDVPAVEVVIMARPTASLAVYLQQFGRALRVLAGKAYGLVIDHVSNWKRHGFPDKYHPWSLARQEKKGAKKEKDPEEIELTACKGCSRPYEKFHPACPYCGFEPPLPDPANRKPAHVDGDFTLLTREMIAEMQAATQLESPASMKERVGFVAGPIAGQAALNRQIEKLAAQKRLTDAIAQWGAIQRAMGRTDAQSYRRFYLTTGMDVLTAQAMDDRAAYEKLAEQVEGWYARHD